MKQTIIAKRSDLRDEFCLGIIVESTPSIAPDSDPISFKKQPESLLGRTGERRC